MERRGHGRGDWQPAALVGPALNNDLEKILSTFLTQAERVGSVQAGDEKGPGKP